MLGPRRPRVATIGLDESKIESISHLCGELRAADSMEDYLRHYSETETDIVVACTLHGQRVMNGVHVFTIGSATSLKYWHVDSIIGESGARYFSMKKSTERELEPNEACPEMYRSLASDLSRQLARSQTAPPIIAGSWLPGEDGITLVRTSSGRPVAMRYGLAHGVTASGDMGSTLIGIALPELANLPAWFRAFLIEVNQVDPDRVPHPPPRLSNPSDWYTPEESELAERIGAISREIELLEGKHETLRIELRTAGEAADAGIRRAIWADGGELVAAVEEILSRLGFAAQNMDSETEAGQPKREDLRLTLDSKPGWEAMVEIKGYTKGTRTNDADRIRQHRERYAIEKGRTPDLVLWITNPHREKDPASRPAIDGNVRDTARIIGAVHVLVADLYLQWALVAHGRKEAEDVVQKLINAEPGLWTPPAPDSAS